MRCQFCGWDNPEGKDCCEKCNKPLSADNQSFNIPSSNPQQNSSRPTDRFDGGSFNPKKTVREDSLANEPASGPSQACPKCGYILENGECASCGYSEANISTEPTAPDSDLKKTMRPIRKADGRESFSLTPISEESGTPEGEPIIFDGKDISLNRDNTDPQNMTITSQEQARISLANGVWTIEDKSDYKTTFVQASRGIELSSGDLILLGTQLYRFDC